MITPSAAQIAIASNIITMAVINDGCITPSPSATHRNPTHNRRHVSPDNTQRASFRGDALRPPAQTVAMRTRAQPLRARRLSVRHTAPEDPLTERSYTTSFDRREIQLRTHCDRGQ